MSLYEGFPCGWCGKEDLTVNLSDAGHDRKDVKICIPCVNGVYEDWKAEQNKKPELVRIK